ncbi:CcmD family protein [Pedobacter psychrophilus]|uniref:CcmD family protein n=1 Tax=Pedobacter psychrophilus TaxID=1826909 RepID=A0A179DHV9_9SPHI|nr:CcmD family protein [Pedobacter psychrophilus]OAQ40657.1 CcmD family protein [Pedobacter psychrophilus]
MKKFISFLSMMFISAILFAQDSKIEMADELRNSGKIYVVVTVMLLLFLAFIIYLFTIDKRLKKIEKGK